jgi:hypothetical protein
MAVAAHLVAPLVSRTPRGVTADGYDGDVAHLDATTLPANGRLGLANALANARLRGQDSPSACNSSPPPTPPARSTPPPSTNGAGCAPPACTRTPRLPAAGAGDRCHADPAGGRVRNRLITDPAVLVRVEAECAYGWEVLVYRVRPDLRRF